MTFLEKAVSIMVGIGLVWCSRGVVWGVAASRTSFLSVASSGTLRNTGSAEEEVELSLLCSRRAMTKVGGAGRKPITAITAGRPNASIKLFFIIITFGCMKYRENIGGGEEIRMTDE